MSLELYVKAGKDGNSLGDCPFSHRIQMILQLKGLDYQLIPINMQIKPREFLDMSPSGKVPVLIHGERLLDDATAIADYLEITFPEPKLRADTPQAEKGGIDIFQKFTAFLKNRDPNKQEQLARALKDELQKLDSFLASSPGMFIDGDELKLPDCNILPKLYHIKVAARHYKKFEMPEEFPSLKRYLDEGFETEAFQKTKCDDEEIIYGWSKHFQ
ncbi:chloride intracellular channel protein 4-like [Ptychodera flava]|uniref:chloride intracellular channel protein 4-like n=1 Tax=Ptychodera flava TaxID=63121 RepID=UPI00396A3A3A